MRNKNAFQKKNSDKDVFVERTDSRKVKKKSNISGKKIQTTAANFYDF